MIGYLANKVAREVEVKSCVDLQKKIIAVAGTERMHSNSGGNDQRPYLVCTVYVYVCTYVHAYTQYYRTCIYTTISATTIQQT